MHRLLPFLLASAAFAAPATPKIGEINIYGLRKLTAARVLDAVGLKAGDPLPPSKGDLEDRLETLPGVVLARVTAVCCEGEAAMLFVGIEERGGPRFAFRSEPTGAAVLPAAVLDAYRRFLEALEAAGRRGSIAEDLTRGHSFMADPAARAVQEEFVSFAAQHLPLLHDVLRNGADPEQRAIAASVIGYAARKTDVLNDLQYALQDPDEAVRANAMRSLTAIAVLAAKQPELGLKVSPTWLIEMLNSVVLSDRLKACEALVSLTEGDRAALDPVRDRSLAAVVEMARWRSLRYAVPAFVLVGRIAGLPEPEIHARWERGDRESVIARVLKPKGK